MRFVTYQGFLSQWLRLRHLIVALTGADTSLTAPDHASAPQWRDEGGLAKLREVVVPARDHVDASLDLANPTSNLSLEMVALARRQITP